jgi:choline dehydrogenase-like flavoprotein
MVEPFSLGALGAIALTDGIKFLYAQAGEILKRRRERTAAPTPAPGLLEGELAPLRLDLTEADERIAELRRLRGRLADIADEIEPAEETDAEVVDATLALREAIESIVGQRITFRGEQREPSGTTITGIVRAREINGRGSGIEQTGSTPTGSLHGEVIADVAGENADIAGVRISGNR